ncbi:ATP-dependent RNA helicase DbpA [Oxobacter pfennigii]|uniref:ATP-dependent RNA helicase DbpA n=1 Tax=Oxobacter pfennigii TaxID=36849 RepID=A0A0P8YB23_9CLOT|nr:DEAD/DEAH box helicase [Oxobacter pfennigii]KPU44239.1 ATP-dependent RNA helicase DbpA [Oxobacter pfennigii]
MIDFKFDTYGKRITGSKRIPPRQPIYENFPESLDKDIVDFFMSQGIDKLYCHQKEMFDNAMMGKNAIITTSTASGKTMSFLLPVINKILKDPGARAIFVYPTKALAHDQYRNMVPVLEHFGLKKLQAGIYDGDTPPNERSRIRKNANIILTNPEMLSSSFLPNHSLFGFNHIFSRLKFLVIDELHAYRGAFGSHMANIMRRLLRICRYYKSSPQFLLSSATIANPVELAEGICGDKFVHIEKDGSPSGEKVVYFWQPPFIRDTQYRKGPEEEASELIPDLVDKGIRFITFCKSRRDVEVVLKETRDRLTNMEGKPALGKDLSHLISGYRGGYTPEERKEIEDKLSAGKLMGVISTNALELGIDIGKLDLSIVCGFPGTKASFWQQLGRAGRRGETSYGLLIFDVSPVDQYIAVNNDWLLNSGVENAVIDKNNLFIQLAHVRAAAAELPLSLDDAAIFPDLGEIVPVLIDAKELKGEDGNFLWSGNEFPAGDFNLRNINNNTYKVLNKANGTIITEMDETLAFHEVHPKAIYIHDSMQYIVEDLDLKNRIATVVPVDMNYFTIPFVETDVNVLREFKHKEVFRTTEYFGDVKVKEAVPAYKMVQFHNHQNLGFERITIPLYQEIETEGLWFTVPDEVDFTYNSYTMFNYYNGLKHSLLNAAMMRTMATREDMSSTVFNTKDENEEVKKSHVLLYDLYPGGLGFSEKAYDFGYDIIEDAIILVNKCSCEDGCPACVGDYHLDKELILWGLKSMLKETEEVVSTKRAAAPPRVIEEYAFEMEELPQRWGDFITHLREKSEYLHSFLSTIDKAEIAGNKLFLVTDFKFYEEWVMEGSNKKKILNTIKRYVKTPSSFEIGVKLIDKEPADIKDKIMRRYDDLIK